MFTREEFARRRATLKAVVEREGRLLAAASVGLGLAQLLYIRWAGAHLPRWPRLATEGGAFLIYMALVGILLWRLESRRRAARPACPQCGAPLEGMSERVATATGHCDHCGGQVIA